MPRSRKAARVPAALAAGTDAGEFTILLRRMGRGDGRAAHDVFASVYDTLRARARAVMRGRTSDNTLQPTALAHEAFLRLVDLPGRWSSRGHFLGVASTAMRTILVDHARTRARRKRKGTGRRVALDHVVLAFEDRSCDLMALDDALKRLAAHHARAAQVVDLRFFGGLPVNEIVRVLGIPKRTVENDWYYARAWLHAELS